MQRQVSTQKQKKKTAVFFHVQRLVSIPKTDLESMEATIETLENRDVMEQLESSEADINAGKVRNIDKFINELEKG